jgi:hypothetical protein
MAGPDKPGLHIFGGHPPLSDDVFATTGRVFYVGSVAVPGGLVGVDDSGSYGYRPERPFATWDYAIGQCTASRSDVIVILPGHAETVTAAITMDIAGVRVIGLGQGRNRPAITASGAIDAVNVTAANCRIHNIRFVGAAASVTAQINVAAADLVVSSCVIEQDAVPLVAVTVASGGNRLTVKDCLFFATADGADFSIDFEAGVSAPTITGCTFNYSPLGIDTPCIRANVNAVSGGLIENCRFICVVTPFIDFNCSDSLSGDGMLSNLVATIGPTTTPADIDTSIDQGGYVNVNVHVCKAATDSGSRVPVATGA